MAGVAEGVAFGGALLLITLIPMAVVGDLHPQFWLAPRAWGAAILALLTLFLGALATEMAFRGYLFQRLIATTGRPSPPSFCRLCRPFL